MIRVCRDFKASGGLNPQTIVPHEPPDAVLADEGALIPELFHDSASSVCFIAFFKSGLDMNQ